MSAIIFSTTRGLAPLGRSTMAIRAIGNISRTTTPQGSNPLPQEGKDCGMNPGYAGRMSEEMNPGGLASKTRNATTTLSGKTEDVKEKFSEAKEKVKEKAKDVKETVKEKSGDVGSKVKETLTDMKEKFQDVGRKLKDKM